MEYANPIETLKALLLAQYEVLQVLQDATTDERRREVIAVMDVVHLRIGQLYAALCRF
jgi:hypothetical protein